MKKHKSKKYHSVITKRILHSVKKLSVVFLMVTCATSLLTIRGTNAGFSDVEESTGNIFSAASLDGAATYIEYFSVVGMKLGGPKPDQTMIFSNVGQLDFRYSIKYRQTGVDATLCDAFLLTAERNGTKVYDKLPLKDFNMNQFPSLAGTPFQIARFGEDTWDFTVELPSDAGSALENKNCTWNFDFTAWQTNLPAPTGGFVDMETAGTHSISTGEWLTAGDVVINEVMWMGSTVSDNDEWIELKNMTGSAISLAGWKLENTKSTGDEILTIPAGKSIPANGYFLIANYTKSHASSALDVEADWVTTTIELNNTNNGNIVLKSPDNVVIDSALGVTAWPVGTNDTLKHSMERNDIPGDGLLAGSWHACVSGSANGAPYWDAVGNNFGTPKAANLSPIVLNEFVMNPVGDDSASRPEGEWIELYNILEEDIDVAGWYFTNAEGDQVAVTADNTASGTTVVPGRGALVVYLERSFLDNTADTLSLYAPGVLPEDVSDDIREDTYSYQDAAVLPAGKSFARFPDGEGIWLDPEATPGDDNVMLDDEKQTFQRQAFGTCFIDEKLNPKATADICSPLFLTYIGLLHDAGDDDITNALLLEILEMIRLEEEQKLLALLDEDGVLTPEELDLVPVAEEKDMTEPEAAEEAGSETTPPIVAREEEVVPEVVPEVIPETTTASEEAPVVSEEPATAEAPVAKVEETPVEVENPVN